MAETTASSRGDAFASPEQATSTGRLTQTTWLVLAVVVAAITVAPLNLSIWPPMADLPNNMARMFILSNLNVIPDLRRFYMDITAAQPNMGMEMIVLPLQRLIGLDAASKTFLAIAMLSLVGGTTLLHRALHGRYSPWPLLSFLLVYNRLLLWGFASYLFSLGLALAAAAVWVATRERPLASRALANVLPATCVYLTHLYGLGVYVLIVAGYELAQYRMTRDGRAFINSVISGVLATLPAAFLFLFVSPTSGAVNDVAWGSWHRRLEAPFTIFYASDWRLDLLCFALVGIGVGVWLFRGKLRFAKPMAGSLILLFVVALMMPDKLFSSYAADHRLPIAFALCTIAAMDVAPLRGWRQAWPLALALVVHVIRVGYIASNWVAADRVYRADLDVIDHLPYGAKVLSVITNARDQLPLIPEYEIASMAVIERQAFVPSVFAGPRNAGQTIAFTPEIQPLVAKTFDGIMYSATLRKLKDPEYAEKHGPFRAELRDAFDYALVVHLEDLPPAARPSADMPIVARSPTLSLIRLHPQAPAGTSQAPP